MEYKFRFVFQHRKDKDYYFEYWTLDEILHGAGESGQYIIEIIAALEDDGYRLVAKDQYTGFKDKYNREIYEGDALFNRLDEYSGVVKYSEPDGMFELHSDGLLENFGQISSKDFEVIGNIHDNPEVPNGT